MKATKSATIWHRFSQPANLIHIRACQELMPGVPMVAALIPLFIRPCRMLLTLYGIPYEYYGRNTKLGRYGFMVASHSYVSKRTAEIVGIRGDQMKIIVCHLGNGASISAVNWWQICRHQHGSDSTGRSPWVHVLVTSIRLSSIS